MPRLHVDTNLISHQIGCITNQLHSFSRVTLSPTDDKSTISANGQSQDSFSSSQDFKMRYHDLVAGTVAGIIRLNHEFDQFDNQMGNINSSGQAVR